MKNRFLNLLAKLYPMAKRGLYRFKGGVFPRYNKSLSKQHPIHQTLIPKQLVLPLQQHVGVEAEALVTVGERVLKNQCLADAKKGLSAPIHAPTSGKIIAIEPRTLPHPSGLSGLCIVLEPDTQDEAIDNSLKVDGSTPETPQQLKDIVYHAGIVGMGGAGFPTFAKIPAEKGKIHTLLINGAECEPFITCDDLLMQTQPQDIIQGALIVAESLGCQRIICGIEDNKPEAIAQMKVAATSTLVEIQPVPTVYPMGGQKQLTQQLTGVEVPAKSHAVDIGILMMNVATFAAIYQAVRHGNPLVSRLVTVSGLGLSKPFNIYALLGTAFDELAQLAEPKTALNYPLIQGGPMMGFEMPNNHVPVVKVTNCILANPPQPTEMVMPCIRCGECMDACPIHLLPQQLYWHSRSHEFEKAEKLNLFDCIECGCCSFVCPSNIPLVQYYRFAKTEVKKNQQEAQAVQLAKQRHEAKLAREEKIKQEREARLKAKKAAVKENAKQTAQVNEPENTTSSAATMVTETGQPVKKAPSAAAAAAARAAAARKQKTADTENTHSDNSVAAPLSAREKAIAAAKKRTASEQPAKKIVKEKPVPNENKVIKTDETESTNKTDAVQKARLVAQKRAQAAAIGKTSPSNSRNTHSSDNSTEQGKVIASESESEVQSTPNTVNESTQQSTTAVDKRKAAMDAARKRAASKKQSSQESGSDA